jgi:hypothetical protein
MTVTEFPGADPGPTPTPTSTPKPTRTLTPTPTPTPTPSRSPAAKPNTPVLVQHISTASDVIGPGYWANAKPGNPYYLHLPNLTGAGNCLVLGVSYPYSSNRTVSVTDDKNDTWQLAATVNNGAIASSIYVAQNVSAGADKVTVAFDTPLYGCQFVLSEFYNVFGIDASVGSSTSISPNISAGSLVRSTPGDLVYNYGYDLANAGRPTGGNVAVTSISAGSGYSLLSADVMLGSFAQYTVLPNAFINSPSATVTGGNDQFNCVAVALKGAFLGTAPSSSAIRIVHVEHVMATKTTPIIFPSTGNMILIATARPESNINYSSVTSRPSNSWTKIDESSIPPGADPPQVWYANNANTSLNETLSVAGAPGPYGTTFVIYDVENAAGFDTSAGRPASFLTTRSPTQSFSGFSEITPSAPGELIFAFLQSSFGPNVSVSPGIMDTVLYGGQIDADLMDNADGYGHYYSSSTSPVSFSYTMNSGGSSRSDEVGIAIAFQSSNGNPTPTPTPSPTPTPTQPRS